MLSTVLWAGCGAGDQGYATGTVTRHDGTPAAGIELMARSTTSNHRARATTDEQGRYEFGQGTGDAGLPPGDYTITATEDLGDADIRKKPTIAGKYADSATSGLSITVELGKATPVDFKLDPPK